MKKKLVSNHYIQATISGALKAGFSAEALLIQAAIPLELRNKPRARITEVQLANLIRSVWSKTGDEFMGLTANPCHLGVFELMAESVLQAKTLGGMLHQSARFYNRVQNDIEFAINQHNDSVDFTLTLRDPKHDPDHLFQEFLLLMWQRFSCWLVNEKIAFLHTRFNYPEPAHIDEYPPMFGGQLLFEQPTSGFTLHSKLLNLPIVRDQNELSTFLLQSPLEILRRVGQDSSLHSQVRRLLFKQGLEHLPTLEQIADSMHMTARTLRRKLKDEGVSYQQIKDRLRCDTAIRLLTEESLSIADISLLIGFTEQAAFCRAFKNWTGVAPSVYSTH
ncbi:AraC family transcriptional regulator [Neptunomonas antarctica]|uniref:AraC-type DNA-binding protein n=1 Tax=Neptunomonas antarctica TaxID=619304 RepID=A0A1N7NSW0_9GAMM|nr:AraC family transcriptional regulator [Neptunomonas antarctica]SIT01455.1 AraC-type DNA-binding protein [Neptunomonas antarctica]